MAKLKIGKLPVYKGEYQDDVNYSRLNLVSYLGTTFQSLTDDNIGHPPAKLSEDGGEITFINTNYWNIIAKGSEYNDNRVATDSNKGYKILKKNKSFAEQVTEENTIYVIQYDFTLDKNITIPKNCVLKFDGGSISAGNGENKNTITGNNTGINAELIKIFSTDIILTDSWNVTEFYPEWFGAVGDGATDDSDSIQAALNCLFGCNNVPLFLSNKEYVIDKTIHIYEQTQIISKINKKSEWGKLPELVFTGTGNAIELIKNYNSIDYRASLCGFRILCNSQTATNGIFYDGVTNNSSLIITIKDVEVRGFGNGRGIYFIDGNGKGIYFSVFDNVSSHENLVGAHFKANTNQNSWFHANRFVNCYFSYNRNCGFIATGFFTAQSNQFENCSFERNGDNYSETLYNELGSCGFKIEGDGNNSIENCYIEDNYPRKTVDNNTIFPDNVLDNANVASIIVSNGAMLLISNNTIASFLNCIKIQYNGGVSISDNYFLQNGIATFETGTRKCPRGLVDMYLNDSLGGDRIKIFSKIYVSTPSFSFIKSTINKIHTDGLTSNDLNKKILADSIKVNIDSNLYYDSNLINKEYAEIGDCSFKVFADKDISGISGLLYGSVYNQPVHDIWDAVSINPSFPSNKNIKFVLLGDCYINAKNTYIKPTNACYNIYGNNNTLIFGGDAGNPSSQFNKCNINFYNCIIDFTTGSAPSGYYSMMRLDSNNKVVFENCVFNIFINNSVLNASLIELLTGGINNSVEFLNCIFNLKDGGGKIQKFFVVGSTGIASKTLNQTLIKHNGCTFNNGLTSAILGESYNMLTSLPTATSPYIPICYNGKWVQHNGTNWVDLNGNTI